MGLHFWTDDGFIAQHGQLNQRPKPVVGLLLPVYSALLVDGHSLYCVFDTFGGSSVGPQLTPFTVTATIDDTTTGGSRITGASYTLNGGTATAMAADDGMFDEAIETVTATVAGGLDAGLYNLCITGTDAGRAEGSTCNSDASDSVCTLLAVYDPDAGFVTGGGWIDSPEGADTANPGLVGRGYFEIVSKYLKGKILPTGVIKFRFPAGDLDFRSDDFEWLVVTEAKAQVKAQCPRSCAKRQDFNVG